LINKKLSRKSTSAVFLAIVLVAGTFAAISPSFVTGVNAQGETNDYGLDDRYNSYEQDYGKDSYGKKPYEQESYGKEKEKSKDSKSDLLKKLKCNNINANINNVDASFGSPPVEDDTNVANGGADSEALAAQGGESISANGLMNGGGRDGDRNFVDRENDFRFVCINNNNNTVIGGEEPISALCEECFAANSALQTEIIDALVEFEGTFVNANEGSVLTIGAGTDTIEQLCDILETSAEFYGAPVFADVLEEAISFIITGEFDVDVPGLDAIIECLSEAGIIVEREVPPDNGLIASANVECTGDPICARIT
jgi:hypothetical protein